MDGFTLVDGIVAAVIILSAILAYSRGFVRESLAILGWIGAAVLAFIFAPAVRPLIAQIPYLNSLIADNCELGTIAGFAVVFALALVLFSILTPLFSSVVQRSALGGVDQGESVHVSPPSMRTARAARALGAAWGQPAPNVSPVKLVRSATRESVSPSPPSTFWTAGSIAWEKPSFRASFNLFSACPTGLSAPERLISPKKTVSAGSG